MTEKDFVRQWNSASSLDELTEKTGDTKARLSARAGYLRRKGFGLKRFSEVNHAPAAEFARAWNSATTVAEVAEKLNISNGTARQRAHHLRSHGFALKYFKTNSNLPVKYLAGYFDARGSISVRKSHTGQVLYRLAISGPLDFLEEVQESWGGTIERNKNSYRLCWLTRQQIERVGDILHAHLKTKKGDLGELLNKIKSS